MGRRQRWLACQLPKTWYSQRCLIPLTHSLSRKWWRFSAEALGKYGCEHSITHSPWSCASCGNLLWPALLVAGETATGFRNPTTHGETPFFLKSLAPCFPSLGTASAVLLEWIFPFRAGGNGRLSCWIPVQPSPGNGCKARRGMEIPRAGLNPCRAGSSVPFTVLKLTCILNSLWGVCSWACPLCCKA